jgi:uncharacterized protein (DUF58 family)
MSETDLSSKASDRKLVTHDSFSSVSASPRPRVPVSRFSKWRNAIFGTLLVVVGLVTALVSVLARRTDNSGLATAAAVLSLVIAGLIVSFIVPPLARSARLELGRLELPVELTSGGGIFLILVAVVAFAAWNTGNNLLFLVFSVLVSTLFVGWMSARASLRELTVSARFPDHIFAGEAAPVIVTLRNKKRLLPSFSTLVEARGPIEPVGKAGKKRRGARFQKRPLAYFVYVPHHAAAEQRVEQLFPERGHVLITGFELSTRFPFGFLRRRRRLGARNVDLIVYPKPEAIGDELHLLPMYAGRSASLRRGVGHDLFSLRDYQPQDDLRHIDWKATARARRLTVREFTSEDERRITIILDTRLNEETDEEKAKFERGVTLAASLAKHFVDERAEVRLIVGSECGRFGSGLEHLYDCLRRLALAAPQTESLDFFSQVAEVEEASPQASTMAGDFGILLTSSAPGSIPARVWRNSHVIYL